MAKANVLCLMRYPSELGLLEWSYMHAGGGGGCEFLNLTCNILGTDTTLFFQTTSSGSFSWHNSRINVFLFMHYLGQIDNRGGNQQPEASSASGTQEKTSSKTTGTGNRILHDRLKFRPPNLCVVRVHLAVSVGVQRLHGIFTNFVPVHVDVAHTSRSLQTHESNTNHHSEGLADATKGHTTAVPHH